MEKSVVLFFCLLKVPHIVNTMSNYSAPFKRYGLVFAGKPGCRKSLVYVRPAKSGRATQYCRNPPGKKVVTKKKKRVRKAPIVTKGIVGRKAPAKKKAMTKLQILNKIGMARLNAKGLNPKGFTKKQLLGHTRAYIRGLATRAGLKY